MHVPVVIVGAGPAGLAMSHHLRGAGIGHVVLERGRAANSWRTKRWDSLRLLTPAWMTALPGAASTAPDPDAFLTASETVDVLDAYRSVIDAPVHEGVAVESVHTTATGFEVRTSDGSWPCDAVVAASGGSSEARLPACAADLPAHVEQLTALRYKRPAQVSDDGRVLVVDASASGVQIADELARAGQTSRSRSVSTSGCRGRTAGATSTSGSTASASSTCCATTRSTTSTAPAGTRRCS